MGAWDVTAFGNDDAADWLADFQDAAKPNGLLENVFELARRSEYLEAPEGSQMVAAAAVVAAARSKDSIGVPPDLVEWIRGKETALARLAPLALSAIHRVRTGESELNELWEEADEHSAWSSELDRIAALLRWIGPAVVSLRRYEVGGVTRSDRTLLAQQPDLKRRLT